MLPIVADGEFRDQRQRESTDDELRDVDGDEAIGVELGAFVRDPPS